jgi:hypothetical protein
MKDRSRARVAETCRIPTRFRPRVVRHDEFVARTACDACAVATAAPAPVFRRRGWRGRVILCEGA